MERPFVWTCGGKVFGLISTAAILVFQLGCAPKKTDDSQNSATKGCLAGEMPINNYDGCLNTRTGAIRDLGTVLPLSTPTHLPTTTPDKNGCTFNQNPDPGQENITCQGEASVSLGNHQYDPTVENNNLLPVEPPQDFKVLNISGNSILDARYCSSVNGVNIMCFSMGVMSWDPEIIKLSSRFGIDARLIATIIQFSGGDPLKVTSSEKMGLFSVDSNEFSDGEDPFLTTLNEEKGMKRLKDIVQKTGGDVRKIFSMYFGDDPYVGNPQEWGPKIYYGATEGDSTNFEYWSQTVGGQIKRWGDFGTEGSH